MARPAPPPARGPSEAATANSRGRATPRRGERRPGWRRATRANAPRPTQGGRAETGRPDSRKGRPDFPRRPPGSGGEPGAPHPAQTDPTHARGGRRPGRGARRDRSGRPARGRRPSWGARGGGRQRTARRRPPKKRRGTPEGRAGGGNPRRPKARAPTFLPRSRRSGEGQPPASRPGGADDASGEQA